MTADTRIGAAAAPSPSRYKHDPVRQPLQVESMAALVRRLRAEDAAEAAAEAASLAWPDFDRLRPQSW